MGFLSLLCAILMVVETLVETAFSSYRLLQSITVYFRFGGEQVRMNDFLHVLEVGLQLHRIDIVCFRSMS